MTGKEPDKFFPFYGAAFFQAVAGYPDDVAAFYIRALWHYWSATHCAGLRDDDDFLRRVCGCPEDRWSNVRPVIFGDFFKLVDRFWRQKRADEEWARAAAVFQSRRLGAQITNQRRWGKRPGGPPPRR